MSLKPIVNGIDVARQRAVAGAMSEPAQLTIATEWLGGTQTRSKVLVGPQRASGQEFAIDADYPDALLGSGTAPSPNALFLAALASSFVTSFVLAAAAAHVRIEFMRVLAMRAESADSAVGGNGEVDELELRGEVDADAAPERLKQLVGIALARSTVVGLCRLTVRAVLVPVGADPGGERDLS